MRAFLTVVLLAVASSAYAMTGYLVKSESVMLVSYQMGWRCTYNVAGKTAVVEMKSTCPSSMEF